MPTNDCELYNKIMIEQSLRLGTGLDMELPRAKTLLHDIDLQSSHHPQGLAMKDSYGGTASYEAVIRKSSSIASRLESIVEPGSTIGLLCEPSIDAICSMLAILRLGAMCVPLDLSNPVTRLKAIVDECQPRAILYHNLTTSISKDLGGPNCAMFNVLEVTDSTQDHIAISAQPHMAALTLYTSGTTGAPKGIILTHQGLSNVIAGTITTLGMGQEVILQQSSLGFDLSIAQIFLALSNGGKLIIARRDQRGDAIELSKLILQERIRCTFCVPSEYSILLRYGSESLKQCRSWRFALSAGERMTSRIVTQFRNLQTDVSLFNGYGPAETTIVSHMGKVLYNKDYAGRGEEYHSVGKSLPNFAVHILDTDGHPVPFGFPGEIYIGGASVSPGYSNNHKLTTEKFVRNPYTTHNDEALGWNHLYRSGDRGRLLSDGSLVPLGRMEGDNQIKLRGMRVELEGVENAILTTAKGGLADAVVVARGEITFLVGFITFAAGVSLSNGEQYLRSLLDQLPLPHYMRPTVLVPLEKMLRTANGKVNRSALEKIRVSRQSEAHSNDDKPLSSTETKLSAIWRDLLHEDESTPLSIFKSTDFFDVGGNSLLVVELQDVVLKAFDVSLSLRDFFQSSSLQNMAALILPDETQEETRINWNEETTIQPDIVSLAGGIHPQLNGTKRVLLTGAFGFLGKAILQLLVDNDMVKDIYCVAIRQRAGSPTRKSPIDSDKIHLYSGDLTRPRLGLSETDFDALSKNVTTIIHNGAEVSFMKTYQSLAKVNVASTRELLRLGVVGGASIHYVSTGGIAGLLSPGTPLPEARLPAEVTPAADGSYGYVASKWASERYLENAATHLNARVWIHRPMYIIGDGAPATDVVNTILQYSVLTKLVPNLSQWYGFFDVTQVENVAGDIVQSVVGEDGQEGTVHVRHQCGEIKIPVDGLKKHLERNHDIECQVAELAEWVKAAEEMGMEPVMVRYLEMLVGQEVHLPNVEKGVR